MCAAKNKSWSKCQDIFFLCFTSLLTVQLPESLPFPLSSFSFMISLCRSSAKLKLTVSTALQTSLIRFRIASFYLNKVIILDFIWFAIFPFIVLFTLSQNKNSKRVLDRFMLIKLTKFWRSSEVRQQWQWQRDTILHWLFVLSLKRLDQSKSAYVRGSRECTESSGTAVDEQRSLHNFVLRASSMKTSDQKLKSARFCSRRFGKSTILTKKRESHAIAP